MSEKPIERRLGRLERYRLFRQGLAVGLLGAVLVATWWALGFVGFEVREVADRVPDFLAFFGGFFPPDFVSFTTYTLDNGVEGLRAIPASFRDFGAPVAESLGVERITLVRASLVTVVVGFLGTVLGFPAALLFGVLGSERVTPFPLNFLFRGVMSAIRAIPALVWIFLYLPIGPPSQVTAVLAIATDTVGNLGRLFTDELEEIDDGPIEAIRSTGASRSQVVSFGMLSQVASSYVAWTLYVLEINTRIAISLGVVGAGGLGYYIRNTQDLFYYHQTAAGIVMVFAVVLSIELVSSRVRARLRPDQHDDAGLGERLRDLADPGKWLGRSDPRSEQEER